MYNWEDTLKISDLLQRITVNSRQCCGHPCIRNMRIRVSNILDLFAADLSIEQILDRIPELEREDVMAALTYASRKFHRPVSIEKTIRNVNDLKAELVSRNIAYEDEMSGCPESEILEIESKYGKLPLSYRQIIHLIGHSAGFLFGDINFYVSTNDDIDQILYINEDFWEFKKETIENNEVDDELLLIPENIFIIDSWDGNDLFVLTDKEEHKEDSPIYVYQDVGTVEKQYLSVWEWIDGVVKTSFDGARYDVSDFRAHYYRKPYQTESGKILIQKGYKK